MSGFNISTIAQTLQNAVIALSKISTSIAQLVIGPSANNNFTGNNTFAGTNTFDPPPIISAGDIGTGTFLPAGSLSAQVSVAGIGNGADTTDDTLFSYTLPAHSLDISGRTVQVEAFGHFATNNNNKTVKIFVGSALWITSGVVTTNNEAWWLRIQFTKGASNTQTGFAVGLTGGVGVPLYVGSGTATETDTAPILIRLTGASPTSGVANDVFANGMTTTFLN